MTLDSCKKKFSWLITGVAGFIGSSLARKILSSGHAVIGIDNFSTGFKKNIEDIYNEVIPSKKDLFQFYEGDIRDQSFCRKIFENKIDIVLHQAALGSIPRSIEDPITTNDVNIGGFLNILTSAKNAGIKSFIYASSSSVYGNSTTLPRREGEEGKILSPYAFSKQANEIYAEIFLKVYGFSSIGLRYFNVFGPRQNPSGAYAAVIPKWISAFIKNQELFIYGDGETSRDFTFIDNVVEANVMCALKLMNEENIFSVYNVGVGKETSLNDLFNIIKKKIGKENVNPEYRPFRSGDVRNSLASLEKIEKEVGYSPLVDIEKGLDSTIQWNLKRD